MTTYFQYNDERTKKPPKGVAWDGRLTTEHGTEIVEIDSYLVTEELPTAQEQCEARLEHGLRCLCWWCNPERGDDL